MEHQTLIYALPQGETERYMEDLISSHCRTSQDVQRVIDAAKKDGWHSFRVTSYDGSPPDFKRTLKL